MEAINTIRKGNYELEIFQDEDLYDTPRNWDNLGTMICFHRRYNLGDKNEIINSDDFNSWSEQREWIEKNIKPAVLLPLYLYDHSGITISTSPFSCNWDSGQIGWIFVTKDRVREEYKVKRITKDIIEKVTKVLEGEVETYDQFLTGEVYGYRISKIEVCDKGCEHKKEVDSCWGYYGMESVEEEGNNKLEYYIEKEEKEVAS
jgi:hypothetical protein